MKFRSLTVVLVGVLLAVAWLVLLLTLVPGKPASAAFPGKNGKIAFVSYDPSDFNAVPEVWTMDPGGANRTFLAEGFEPAWSPDGTKIAFASQSDGEAGRWSEIYVMDADGSNQTNITNTTESVEGQPAWSPDGTKIAFVRGRDVSSDVWTMNADGSNPTLLFSDGGQPAWSPDGTKIAFTHDPYPEDRIGDGIYTINADGSGLTIIQEGFGRGDALTPNWSPDGTKIAFGSHLDSGGGPEDYHYIWVINADGSGLSQLTESLSTYSPSLPAWSPDGTKIAFDRWGDSETGGPGEIYVMDADGSNQTNITNTPDIYEYDPDWQPLAGPRLPTSKAQCKQGGYKDFGFKNQGLCEAYVQKAKGSQ